MFSASKTAAPVSGSFQVSNSLRFRSSASAYLSRTPSSASNRQTWTWSGWVKRGALASRIFIFGPGNISSNGFYFEFNSSDQINIGEWNISAYTYDVVTTQVFRDPSAWYHLVLAFDTTQATAANRIKLYVNGVQVTSFGTTSYPSQNFNGVVNSTQGHSIGDSYANGYYFDGYMAEVNFIDGQALTPSSFGSINATTGVWQPAKYTGSYGTNGFYLKFNNGTSTTTLGYDSSGNSNNWTTNNISLTAGSTYDWMLDSPTSYAGSSYGVGNYAVLNPLQSKNTGVPFDGNLSLSGPYYNNVASVSIPSSGKWYFEVNTSGYFYGGSSDYYYGTAGIATITSGTLYSSEIIIQSGSGTAAGGIYVNGTISQSVNAGSSGNIMSVAVDMDALTIKFYINNSQVGTNVSLTSGTTYFPAVGTNGVSGNYSSAYANFGQRPFAYTPPTGYKSLCTQNLPVPAIVNGSAHMNAVLDTGANIKTTSQNLYTYYLEWIKDRANVNNHQLADTVRGNTAILQSNTIAAETTYTAPSGNSVGWVWNANAAAVTNTAGSITSQVSANTTAGFSVVTYSAGASNSTVGHGLGVAPSFIIAKSRNNTRDWVCYHVSLGVNSYLLLDKTDAAGSFTNYWGSNATTFSVSTNGYLNNIGNMVAYCFAAIQGYSAFGSYTGNGSADGPFVYCGFRPRYVLLKCSSTTDNWNVRDTARDPYNIANYMLFPNLSDGGYTYDGTNTSYPFDILSNGFKLRSGVPNTNAATYIYAAFAENPFQNSLAR